MVALSRWKVIVYLISLHEPVVAELDRQEKRLNKQETIHACPPSILVDGANARYFWVVPAVFNGKMPLHFQFLHNLYCAVRINRDRG